MVHQFEPKEEEEEGGMKELREERRKKSLKTKKKKAKKKTERLTFFRCSLASASFVFGSSRTDMKWKYLNEMRYHFFFLQKVTILIWLSLIIYR